MAKIWCILLVVFSCSSHADAVSKREKIVEYFRVTGVMDSIERNAELGIKMMRDRSPEADPAFWESEEFVNAISWWKSEYLEANVAVAMAHISEQEITDIVEFLKTQTGQRFLDITIRLQPYYDEANAKVLRGFNEKLKCAQRKYREP